MLSISLNEISGLNALGKLHVLAAFNSFKVVVSGVGGYRIFFSMTKKNSSGRVCWLKNEHPLMLKIHNENQSMRDELREIFKDLTKYTFLHIL